MPPLSTCSVTVYPPLISAVVFVDCERVELASSHIGPHQRLSSMPNDQRKQASAGVDVEIEWDTIIDSITCDAEGCNNTSPAVCCAQPVPRDTIVLKHANVNIEGLIQKTALILTRCVVKRVIAIQTLTLVCAMPTLQPYLRSYLE